MALRQPGHPGCGRCVVTLFLGVERIAEMCHDQMRQTVLQVQGVTGSRQVHRQVRSGDGHPGVRVGDVVFEFFAAVHRVDWYHHRVGAQDGPVCNHELRTVLHVQNDPVAFSHADVLQAHRQSLCLAQQVAVACGAAEKNQRDFVWVTQRAHGQVVPQRGGWRRDGARYPLGPEFMMGSCIAVVHLRESRQSH